MPPPGYRSHERRPVESNTVVMARAASAMRQQAWATGGSGISRTRIEMIPQDVASPKMAREPAVRRDTATYARGDAPPRAPHPGRAGRGSRDRAPRLRPADPRLDSRRAG